MIHTQLSQKARALALLCDSIVEAVSLASEGVPGGTLYARYGKGVYIFTAYAWFRQLPAGVPGAYRIFANMISAGKVAHP